MRDKTSKQHVQHIYTKDKATKDACKNAYPLRRFISNMQGYVQLQEATARDVHIKTQKTVHTQAQLCP